MIQYMTCDRNGKK